MDISPKLTQLSHGGGCGCKIAPSTLERILREIPVDSMVYPKLLVGLESSDDAAVYSITGEIAIVVTTDFFMPIVDDPYDFGRIAAANAISDVYAMGARPILALAVLAMPIKALSEHTIHSIARGGIDVCRAADIPLAGGHSIDSVEPIYGLVVVGTVPISKIRRNSAAMPGDVLMLGKPLGIGILSAAIKKNSLSDDGYKKFIENTTKLNSVGPVLADNPDVHAMTDVTGFALLGHALEMCRGSGVTARIFVERVPIITEAIDLACRGFVTGASARNWESYKSSITLPPGLLDWQRNLLTDPQTSGGLLVAVAPESVSRVQETFLQWGFADAAVIGVMEEGMPRVIVE